MAIWRDDLATEVFFFFDQTLVYVHFIVRRQVIGASLLISGGVAFLKRHVRRGILPKMLEEIIDTRLMVKRSMKLYNQESKKNEGQFF
jgi:DNA polymerase family B